MRNAWLIRPVPHGIPRVTEFKEKGIIAVGWPCIGNLKGKSREDLKHLLSLPPYSLTGLALGNAYATIDIFCKSNGSRRSAAYAKWRGYLFGRSNQ